MLRSRTVLLGALALIATMTAQPLRAADEDKRLVGEWIADIGDGLKEAWQLQRTKDGKWRAVCEYVDLKSNKIVGGCQGKDYDFKDDKLTFTQVWLKKPRSSWGDNAICTFEAAPDGKVKLSWELNGARGSRELAPLKRKK